MDVKAACRRVATFLLISQLAIASVACGGDSDGEPTPTSILLSTATAAGSAEPGSTETPPPSPTPEVVTTVQAPLPPTSDRPGAGNAPSGTVSGVSEIDAIIASLQANDAQVFAAYFELLDTHCTTADGLGGPPKCSWFPGSPPDGTAVQAFPYGVCEGSWTTDVEGLAAAIVANQPGAPRPDPSLPKGASRELFGVVRFDPARPLYANEPGFPMLEYFVLLEFEYQATPRLGFALGVSGGRVVSLSMVCVGPPELILDHYDGYTFILRGPAYR
jgi:hypothetical protein